MHHRLLHLIVKTGYRRKPIPVNRIIQVPDRSGENPDCKLYLILMTACSFHDSFLQIIPVPVEMGFIFNKTA